MMYMHERSTEADKAQHAAWLLKHGVDAARTLPPPVYPAALALDVLAVNLGERSQCDHMGVSDSTPFQNDVWTVEGRTI